MKHAVIVGHPNPDSFTLAVANRYCDAVRNLGHKPVLRDLYRMGFDPCLKAREIPRPKGFTPDPDVVAERGKIGDADVFVFVHPLWFYDRPAIVKGYIDRVFGMGFGYSAVLGGANQPLLGGRKLVSFTSSGAPEQWLKLEGTWEPIRRLLDQHLANVCGFTVLDHVHFGEVTPALSETAFAGYLETVDQTVEHLFKTWPEEVGP
jgi:NAD(P)H dehydrogenase (quinone)